jgi:uncharacterized membrane protein
MRSGLRLAALGCHALLAVALTATVLRHGATPIAMLLSGLLAAPLLLTWLGLLRGRRNVERWLALLLVPYAGGAAVEVVATAGTAAASGAALLAALLEIGLLLAIIRRAPQRRQAAPE